MRITDMNDRAARPRRGGWIAAASLAGITVLLGRLLDGSRQHPKAHAGAGAERRGSYAPPGVGMSPDELVEESSQESFPASDPPSFNPGTAGAPRGTSRAAATGSNTARQSPADGGAARLRSDIDNRRTGDKIAASDPAAIPPDTDAE